jgi:hypothetical protein
LYANDAGNADINARAWLLGARGGGRSHIFTECCSRKKRYSSRPDCYFAPNLHRYLRLCRLSAVSKQPETRTVVPVNDLDKIGRDVLLAPNKQTGPMLDKRRALMADWDAFCG